MNIPNNNNNNNSEREKKHTCVGGVHVLVGWVKGVEREREREGEKNTKE